MNWYGMFLSQLLGFKDQYVDTYVSVTYIPVRSTYLPNKVNFVILKSTQTFDNYLDSYFI